MITLEKQIDAVKSVLKSEDILVFVRNLFTLFKLGRSKKQLYILKLSVLFNRTKRLYYKLAKLVFVYQPVGVNGGKLLVCAPLPSRPRRLPCTALERDL